MSTITGTNGNDVLNGTSSGETLAALGGDDSISAGGGNDILIGGAGNDALDGGDGTDTARYAGKASDYQVVHLGGGSYVILSLASPVYTGLLAQSFVNIGQHAAGVTTNSVGKYGTDYLYGIEKIQFSDGTFDLANTAGYLGTLIHLAGDGQEAFFDSNIFADSQTATNGDDTLSGSTGSDVILTGDGADTVHAGAGDDIIAGSTGGFSFNPAGATVTDPDGNDGDGFTVVGGDTLYGEDGNDDIYAGYGTLVDGGAGVDTVHLDLSLHWEPWVAHTILTWFNGLGVTVDLRQAASGSIDLPIDGLGNLHTTLTHVERFSITFGRGNDHVIGGTWNDVLDGNRGDDHLDGYRGNDILIGGDGADTLIGGAGDDTLEGDNGADRLIGGAGSDLLLGGDDKDILSGGLGDDRLIGEAGADRLSGGAGSDTFVFDALPATSAGRDIVSDFEHGIDKIEISMSGFGGSAGFSGSGSLLTLGSAAHSTSEHLLYDAATGLLRFDPDGNGPERAIAFAQFTNKPVLDAGDFTLVF